MTAVQIHSRRRRAKPAPVCADEPPAKTEAELEAERLAARRAAEEAEMLEMQAAEQHAAIHNMTREQAATFALRAFGVRVDATQPRDEVMSQVRHVMRIRGG